ncbi:hypothetical protein EZV62_006771 [Acer yangbiense]|uniref:LRAT domain-containing protein n=1 Tax=Acer yangbiense TaxID=1000413 RepID=A0A5C7IAS5_9ROSI|nr:hypothetical protein EZV62_006771 [Acer yangbiense]
MGLLSNKIDRQELKHGDHIYCWRQAFIYAHHGIYVGEGKVIHFTQRPAGQENGRFIISSSLPTPQFSDVPCPQCGDQNSSFSNGVILSCIDCFLSGGELKLFEYGVSRAYFLANVRGGTCTLATSDPPEDVLHRANILLKYGFGLSFKHCNSILEVGGSMSKRFSQDILDSWSLGGKDTLQLYPEFWTQNPTSMNLLLQKRKCC